MDFEFFRLLDEDVDEVEFAEFIGEIPEEVVEALDKRIKGALWRCEECQKTFVDEIESVATAVPERAKKGCAYCQGGGSARPVLRLMAFLTEAELKELKALHTGGALGVVKIVPW